VATKAFSSKGFSDNALETLYSKVSLLHISSCVTVSAMFTVFETMAPFLETLHTKPQNTHTHTQDAKHQNQVKTIFTS